MFSLWHVGEPLKPI